MIDRFSKGWVLLIKKFLINYRRNDLITLSFFTKFVGIAVKFVFVSKRGHKNDNVFIALLAALGVKHTTEFSNSYYNEHPHKYNLLGLSQMLSEYGIENVAVRINEDDKCKDISHLSVPFVAQVDGDFAVVHHVGKEKVDYAWRGNGLALPLAKFCSSWSGVALLAETTESSEEPGYKENYRKELLFNIQKNVILIAAACLVAIALLSGKVYSDWRYLLLLLLNFMGVSVCYLLIMKQMRRSNTYADKVCSLFKKGNCNDILETSAAKPLGVISWSAVGFGYFLSNFILTLFCPRCVFLLAVINICVLPYSFWSIWYQKYRAKQWCALCLFVQVLLWLIFIVDWLGGFIVWGGFSFAGVLFTGCVYSIGMLLVNMLMDKSEVQNELKNANYELNSMKARKDVFSAMLSRQPRYDAGKKISGIMFGNPDASLFISVLTNPHCNPCARLHKRIRRLLETVPPESVCIQYVFSSFHAELESSARFLIAAYRDCPDERQSIFDRWFDYGKDDRDAFFRHYDLDIDTDEVLGELERHKEWRRNMGFNATPVILVNGYKLPDCYKIEDLRFFIS